MGLDVYLYRLQADLTEIKAKEAEYETRSQENWDRALKGRKYEDVPDDVKDPQHVNQRDSQKSPQRAEGLLKGFNKTLSS